jgi:hypothetical protein
MSESTETAVGSSDLEINSYEVPVEIRLDAYDGLEQLLDDVRATAANTIIQHVDEFWRDGADAHQHVEGKVEFDEAHVQRELELGEADVIRVETVTELGIVGADD